MLRQSRISCARSDPPHPHIGTSLLVHPCPSATAIPPSACAILAGFFCAAPGGILACADGCMREAMRLFLHSPSPPLALVPCRLASIYPLLVVARTAPRTYLRIGCRVSLREIVACLCASLQTRNFRFHRSRWHNLTSGSRYPILGEAPGGGHGGDHAAAAGGDDGHHRLFF